MLKFIHDKFVIVS